jgi:hypothetical protein
MITEELMTFRCSSIVVSRLWKVNGKSSGLKARDFSRDSENS